MLCFYIITFQQIFQFLSYDFTAIKFAAFSEQVVVEENFVT